MYRTIYQKIIIALICFLSLIIPSFIIQRPEPQADSAAEIAVRGDRRYAAGDPGRF